MEDTQLGTKRPRIEEQIIDKHWYEEDYKEPELDLNDLTDKNKSFKHLPVYINFRKTLINRKEQTFYNHIMYNNTDYFSQFLRYVHHIDDHKELKYKHHNNK